MVAAAAAALLAIGMVTEPAAGAGLFEEAKLTASDAAKGAHFGSSVAAFGSTVIVGSPDDGGMGSAHIFVRSNGTWTQQSKLTASDAALGDNFGFSVAIFGDTAVVGARGDDVAGSAAGSAYVFERSGEAWVQQAKLTASDASSFDRFGWSVSVWGDTAFVGAPHDGDTGSAYVFARSGAVWAEQAKLMASDAAVFDEFGFTVGLSEDTAIVGSPSDDDAGFSSGSTYVFVRSNGNWSQQAKLTASDAAGGDVFGASVGISGDAVVVGARRDDDAGSNSGAGYVFVRSDAAWLEEAKLTASDAVAGDRFGFAVAVSGDTAILGSPFDSDAGLGSGSAYAFVRSAGAWFEEAKLTASDADAFDNLGSAVAISGDVAVLGSAFDDDAGSDSGSVYVFAEDTTPPSIVATAMPEPNAAGWNNTLPVDVSFDCEDTGSGVAICPAPVTVSSETAEQTITGTAVDNVGNAASTSLTVRVDTTPPVVTIDDPSSGTELPLPAPTINGTVTDPLSGVSGVEVTFTNLLTMATQTRQAIVDGGNWSVPTSGLTPGPTSASASGTDVAGNVTSTGSVSFFSLG